MSYYHNAWHGIRETIAEVCVISARVIDEHEENNFFFCCFKSPWISAVSNLSSVNFGGVYPKPRGIRLGNSETLVLKCSCNPK